MGCGGSKKDAVIEPMPLHTEKSSHSGGDNTIQNTVVMRHSLDFEPSIKVNSEVFQKYFEDLSNQIVLPKDRLVTSCLDHPDISSPQLDLATQPSPVKHSEPSISLFEGTEYSKTQKVSLQSSLFISSIHPLRPEDLNTSTIVDEFESIALSQLQTPNYTNLDADYCIARVWQGFIQIFSTKGKKIYKRYDSKFSMSARAIVMNDGQIIITGGSTSPRLAIEIDRLAINIKILPEMITGRENHALAYSGTRVYAIGGHHNKTLSECEYYENGKWVSMPKLNKARQNHSAIENIGMVYVFGGKMENSIEMWNGYDWVLLDVSLPEPVTRIGVAPFSEGELLLVGGSIGPPCKTAWKLNLISGEFSSLRELPVADIFSNSGLKIKNKVYLLGASAGYVYHVLDDKWDKVDQAHKTSYSINCHY
jgi:hypothetical protein